MIPIGIPFIKPNLHPFLFITGALMLGISWQATQLYTAICILTILLIFAAISIPVKLYSSTLIIGAALGVFFLGAYRFHTIQQQQAQFYEITHETTFDIIGYVTDKTTVEHPICDQRVTIAINKMCPHAPTAQWQHADALVQIYTRDHTIAVGDLVNIRSIKFKKPANGSFNDYLLKEGVVSTLFINKLDSLIIHRPTFSCTRGLHALRKRLHDTLSKKIGRTTFQLFSSIFLGSKPMPKKTFENSKEHFNTWGVTHYLARSGLHMVIFIFVWHLLLNLLPIYFMYKQIVLVVLSMIYCLLSWPSVSFNRALLSFLLYKACTLLRLATNFLHILSMVCFVVLLYNPLHLFFLDFQLSFGLTFALGLFAQLQAAKS